jgi:hypothetical protein
MDRLPGNLKKSLDLESTPCDKVNKEATNKNTRRKNDTEKGRILSFLLKKRMILQKIRKENLN